MEVLCRFLVLGLGSCHSSHINGLLFRAGVWPDGYGERRHVATEGRPLERTEVRGRDGMGFMFFVFMGEFGVDFRVDYWMIRVN
mgnify:CR=1 FL=1